MSGGDTIDTTTIDDTAARSIVRSHLRVRGFDKNKPSKAGFKKRTEENQSVKLDDIVRVLKEVFPDLVEGDIRVIRVLLTEMLREILSRGYTVRVKGLCKIIPYRTSARKYFCPRTGATRKTEGQIKARLHTSLTAFKR